MRRTIRWPRRAAAHGVPIGSGERALTGAHESGGAVVVATEQALYHRNGPASWSRLCWETIDEVGWNDQLQTLTITRLPPAGPVRLRLAHRTPLLDFARERVRSTILATSQVPLDGRICARLTARRAPGSDRITWVVALQDAADPAVRAAVAAAIAELASEFGLVLRGVQVPYQAGFSFPCKVRIAVKLSAYGELT